MNDPVNKFLGDLVPTYSSPLFKPLFWCYMAFTFPRACPVVMFLLDMMSKVLTLLLVSNLTLSTYPLAEKEGLDAVTSVEYFLILQLVGIVLYEIGQGSHLKKGLLAHVNNIWNMFDFVSSFLLVLWLFFGVLSREDSLTPQV